MNSLIALTVPLLTPNLEPAGEVYISTIPRKEHKNTVTSKTFLRTDNRGDNQKMIETTKSSNLWNAVADSISKVCSVLPVSFFACCEKRASKTANIDVLRHFAT